MNSKYIDFTGSTFATGKEWNLLQQAISYDRCASIVANAFLNGLVKSGLNMEQAFNVYTSKALRHKLDWDLEDKLEKVAFKAGQNVGAEYKMYYRKFRKEYAWMNDELDIPTQQELERRLEKHEEEEIRKV